MTKQELARRPWTCWPWPTSPTPTSRWGRRWSVMTARCLPAATSRTPPTPPPTALSAPPCSRPSARDTGPSGASPSPAATEAVHRPLRRVPPGAGGIQSGADMEVILVNSRGETREMTLRDLLPWSFDGSYLGRLSAGGGDDMILRFVTPQDCPARLDIYAQYIDTGVTFEYDLPHPGGVHRPDLRHLPGLPLPGLPGGGPGAGLRLCPPGVGAGGLPVERGAERVPGPRRRGEGPGQKTVRRPGGPAPASGRPSPSTGW